MAFSQKNCALAFLLVLAVCLQKHSAHVIPARCSCLTTMKYIPDIISDFRVLEKRPGCDTTEVIVTVEKPDMPREEICLNTEGRMAKAFLMCWTDSSLLPPVVSKDKQRREQENGLFKPKEEDGVKVEEEEEEGRPDWESDLDQNPTGDMKADAHERRMLRAELSMNSEDWEMTVRGGGRRTNQKDSRQKEGSMGNNGIRKTIIDV